MKQVFVTRKIPEKGLAILREKFEIKVWPGDIPPPHEVLITETKQADAILSLLTDQIDSEVLNNAQNLKIVANYAVGFDNIDLKTAKNRGIIVTNTPDVLTETTADLAFALLISAARRIAEADQFVRNGEWVSWGPRLLLGQDLYNKTLGIIGLGRIGAAVARRALGFNMNLLYYNRSPKKDYEKELSIKKVSLQELLSESDFISMHLPLNQASANLIGEKEFAMMKKSCVFVNTARGGVVDETALIKALKTNQIFASGLDVFAQEPLKEINPLLKMKNVVLAPHIGSASIACRNKMAEIAALNIEAVLEGKKPLNPVLY